MKPAQFSREAPCTKVHIWRAFRRNGRYPAVPVVEARSIIGLPAPKYLLGKGYIVLEQARNVDTYKMTTDGIQWLEAGLRRHLELHPEDASDLHEPLPTAPKARARTVSIPVPARKLVPTRTVTPVPGKAASPVRRRVSP